MHLYNCRNGIRINKSTIHSQESRQNFDCLKRKKQSLISCRNMYAAKVHRLEEITKQELEKGINI